MSRASNLLGDDPRDGSEERPDELDRTGFVDYVGGLVNRVREQSDSSVMALIGEWGSGKSSILSQLCKNFREDDGPWTIVEFNPWSYPNPESLQAGFFAELRAQLPKEARGGDLRKKIGELSKAVSPYSKVISVVGVDPSDSFKALGEALVGDTSVTASARAVAEELRKAARPILVVLDDLDRLTPDELLAVLKLVRHVGRLPHVFYLLGYDEETLLDVLGQTSLVGTSPTRARDYLEKIIQVRLDMPAFRVSQRAVLLDRGLSEVLTASETVLSEQDTKRLSNLYSNALERRLATPRSISRFMGQVLAFYPPLAGEVDFVDFFLITWLRTDEPGVYRMLATEREALFGNDIDAVVHRQESATVTRLIGEWNSRLSDAGVAERDMPGVTRVVSELFPHVSAVFESGTVLASARPPKSRGVGDPDYFERYFSFGVPAEDISDQAVQEALRTLDTSGNKAFPGLKELAVIDSGKVLGKIRSLRDEGFPIPDRRLLIVLVGLMPHVRGRRRDVFSDPVRELELAVAQSLAAISDEPDLDAMVRSLTDTSDGLEVVSMGIERLLADTRNAEGARVTEGAKDVLRDAIKRELRTYFGMQIVASVEAVLCGPFWSWWRLDRGCASDWVRSQVEEERWALEDVVAGLVSEGVASGNEGTRAVLGNFSVGVLAEAFGLPVVFDALAELLDEADVVGQHEAWALAPTPANRLRFGFSELKRIRDDSVKVGSEAVGPGLATTM
jgi:hypothetical protein